MLVDDRDQQAAAPQAPDVAHARMVDDRQVPGTAPQIVDDRTGDWTDYLPTPKHALETAAGVGIPMAAYAIGGPGLSSLAAQGVEYGRQYLEGEPWNSQAAGVEGALALVPGGKGADTLMGNVAKRALYGTALGAAGEVPRELARSGQFPSVPQAAIAGGIGGLTGGVIGGGEHAYMRYFGSPSTAKVVDDRSGAPSTSAAEPAPIVPRETAPAPLRETYGPGAPRTGSGQPELFPALPLSKVSTTPETLQNAPGATNGGPGVQHAAPEPIAQPASKASEPLRFWEMSPEELQSLEGKAVAHDRATMQDIFGDKAPEVDRQIRRGTFNEDSLTPEQYRRIYQDAPFGDPEEVADYRRAINEIDAEATDPAALGHALRFTITKLSHAPADPAEMSYAQRIAYAQLRRAHELAQERGWNIDEISRTAVQGAAARFSDPADAEFMLGQFQKTRQPVTRSLSDQAASPEAISRLQGERTNGVQMYRQAQRGGAIEPLPATVDRVDTFAQGDQILYRLENGKVSVVGTGPDVSPNLLGGARTRFERDLRAQLTQPGPSRRGGSKAPVEAPQVTRRQIEGPVGGQVEAFGINDPTQRYKFQYRAVPLDELAVNAPDVQPRDRSRFTSTQQVDELARTFDADRYLSGNEELDRGVPIVGPDAAVESGNGRVLALRALRARDPARFAQVIERQRQRSQEFGLTPDAIGPDSVIVRERVTPVKDRMAFADEANARAGVGMAPVETAGQDARRLEGANMLDLQVGESQTIDQALMSPRNRGPIAKFLGTFPANERATMVTGEGDALNPAGVQRLKAAILAKTYQGEAGDRLVRAATESTDTGVKNVESAIFASLGKVAKAEDLVASGARAGDLSITEDIAAATAKLAQLRAEGQPVETYLKQGAMFDRELTPFQETLLDHFDTMSRSSKRIRRLIEGLADEVIEAPSPGQGSLLGLRTAADSKDQLLARALKRTGEVGLFGDVGAIGRRPRRPTGRPGERPKASEDETKAPSFLGYPLGHGKLPPPLPGVERPGPANVQGPRLSSDRPDELARSLNENLKNPEDIQQVQDALAEHIRANIEYARRGVVPQEETKRAAEEIGLEDLLKRKRGEALDAPHIFAAVRINKAQLALFRESWQQAHRSGSDADRVEMMRQMYTTFATTQQAAGAVAEAGRTMNILNSISRDPSIAAINRAMERIGGKENVDAVIEDLLKFSPNDDAALNRYIGSLARATKWDKAHEYYHAALVSGPQTHLAQFAGNLTFALERPALKVAQVGADVLRHAVTGAPRERFLGEVGADLAGMYGGIRAGSRSFLRALTEEGAQQGKLETPLRQAIGGRTGRIIRAPLRLLSAGDEFFKAINVQGHLAALAFRRATKEGLTGQAFKDRIAEIISRPEAIEGFRDELQREALYRTFQNRGGEFTQSLKRLRRSTNAGPIILPFIQTPVNVFKATVERSPFALVDILQRANAGTLHGAQLSDEVTRALVGTGIAAAAVLALKEGAITGFGPVDPKQRAAWRATGAQPYSFKIPQAMASLLGLKSQWINYGRIEPWGTAIGWAADTGELLQHTEAEDAVTKAGFLIGKGITSKTWMQGVSGFFNAIDDPKNYLQQFIQKFAGSAIVPNAIAQLSRAVDPVLRKPRTIAETLQSRVGLGGGIEGYVNEVGPVRDVFGEPVITAGGPIERAISPIYRSYTREEDPARAEVARLQISPGSPQRQLSGIKMTPKEYDHYVEESGALAHKLLDRLVRSPGYRGLHDEQKEDAVHRTFLEARAYVRERTRGPVIRRGLSEGLKPKAARSR